MIYVDAIVVLLSILAHRHAVRAGRSADQFRQPGGERNERRAKHIWTSSGGSSSKNGAAYWSLWLLVPMFLMAIFAPLIASNVPFVFHDGETTIYPWLCAPCSIRDENVDFVFNMALVGFVPWLVVGAGDELAVPAAGSGRAGERLGPGGCSNTRLIIAGAVPAVRRPAALRPACRENPVSRIANFPERADLQSGGNNVWGLSADSLRPDRNRSRCRVSSRRCFASRPTAGHKANDGFIHLLGTDQDGPRRAGRR